MYKVYPLGDYSTIAPFDIKGVIIDKVVSKYTKNINNNLINKEKLTILPLHLVEEVIEEGNKQHKKMY